MSNNNNNKTIVYQKGLLVDEHAQCLIFPATLFTGLFFFVKKRRWWSTWYYWNWRRNGRWLRQSENRDSVLHGDVFFNPVTKNNNNINKDIECEEERYQSDMSGMWSSLHRMFDKGNELKVKNEKKS